jgi:hypothetical protein
MLASLGIVFRQHCQFLTLAPFLLKTILGEGINKHRSERQQSQNHEISKNLCLEKIRTVVQWIMIVANKLHRITSYDDDDDDDAERICLIGLWGLLTKRPKGGS